MRVVGAVVLAVFAASCAYAVVKNIIYIVTRVRRNQVPLPLSASYYWKQAACITGLGVAFGAGSVAFWVT